MSSYDSELSKLVAELNRAAPSNKPVSPHIPQSTPSLDQLLHSAAARHATDVLLIVSAPPMLRSASRLVEAMRGSRDVDEARKHSAARPSQLGTHFQNSAADSCSAACGLERKSCRCFEDHDSAGCERRGIHVGRSLTHRNSAADIGRGTISTMRKCILSD